MHEQEQQATCHTGEGKRQSISPTGWAQSYWQKAVDQGCNASTCVGSAKTEYDHAKAAITVANVSAIAGGVLVAGGLVLVLTAPSTSGPARSLSLTPILAPGTGQLALTGGW